MLENEQYLVKVKTLRDKKNIFDKLIKLGFEIKKGFKEKELFPFLIDFKKKIAFTLSSVSCCYLFFFNNKQNVLEKDDFLRRLY